MLIQENLTLQQKLEILSDAAKYDVACTSSGADRRGKKGTTGSAVSCGICHSFAADGRCISLLKILLTNECIYDCRYCVNRISNDTVRTSFTPEEICTLTMEFYRRNYIEGLFLSSGILHTPNYTMEQIYQSLFLLREKYRFWGYIHVKAIPGADPELIARVGHLADRMSINLELPTGDGLKKLAPAKTRERILTPMRQIQKGIRQDQYMVEERKREKKIYLGSGASASGGRSHTAAQSDVSSVKISSKAGLAETKISAAGIASPSRIGKHDSGNTGTASLPSARGALHYEQKSRFVPAGQSTQMIIGATPETDHQILQVTEALYQKFDLKRVFFSAYTAVNDDSELPALGTKPPLLREHRLYQADWLLRFYGFEASELLTEERPYFHQELDPKCDWAIRHLENFPVEINRADYTQILRVPGIGVKSARRIVQARRSAKLDFPDLKKFGVVLKRAAYFITCNGKMMNPTKIEEEYLTHMLTADSRNQTRQLADQSEFRQLSLFDDFALTPQPSAADNIKSLTGQM